MGSSSERTCCSRHCHPIDSPWCSVRCRIPTHNGGHRVYLDRVLAVWLGRAAIDSAKTRGIWQVWALVAAVTDCICSSAGGSRSRHCLAFRGPSPALSPGQPCGRSAGWPIAVGWLVLGVPVDNASIRSDSGSLCNFVGMARTDCELAIADSSRRA